MGLLSNLTGWHAIIIVGVVVLLFGARKLPSLARSIGQSMRILKEELPSHGRDERGDDSQLTAADAVGAKTDLAHTTAERTLDAMSSGATSPTKR